jgi:GGDEF domain-containing protein
MVTSTEQVIPAVACTTYEALFDVATRLPGWPIVLDRTAVALARASRLESQVMIVVLDDVKAFRGATIDLPGAVAALRERLRADDTVARVDERTLIVVCNDVKLDVDAARIARRLVAHSGVDANLGIALSGGHDDPKSLLTEAVRDAREHRVAV